VKAAPFRYERPGELVTALTLTRDPDAKALAGGQSLVPVMAMRLARPRVLVDLARVAELRVLEERGHELLTGAMITQRALEQLPGLAEKLPLLAAALPHVGHREVRNRGTIGGSIAHADPAAELGLVAATLRARIEARSLEGSRELDADGFARGPFQTALGPGELLSAVRWPLAQPGDGFAFAEVARRHGDFALCGAAVHVRQRAGTVEFARVGLMGVAPTPVVYDVGNMLAAGEHGAGSAVDEVARELAGRIEPGSDMHASAGYRRRLARTLTARGLRWALSEESP
jgi:2-furoyl-CoA dehydrogenase FAD binding subunit